jgi:ABC-type glycerol-3-phosphate transport system substrate-binding protein
MSNAVGLYTYTFGETQLKPLMNFVNSDFPASYLNQFAFLDQETFVAMYYNEDDYSLASAIFHYVDPSEIPDKKILVLGVNGYWGRISTMVREFNKSNEEYRIVLRDYSQYNTNEDYMAGYTKLNNDILAGDIPDILSVSNAMPLDSYRSQGLFLDWRPLYEADEELKHVELMENVLNTISGGEKWYYMFSEFSVQTVIGREEFVGSPQDWNLDKFLSLAKADPQRMMFSDMTQSYFLSQLMSFCGNQFIDPATGKCDFTSDTFIKLLEYTATLPAEIDYSNLPEDYYIERNNQYRNGTTLLQWGYLDSVSSFKYFYVDMGEEVVMLGFPGENGGISNLSYNDAVTISSKTKNKDGAWEFIKFYLSEEMAEKYNYGQFPIRRDSFDMKADEAMERPYYMQGDERVYYDDMYYIDGEQIIMEPLTAAQVEEIVTFVEGISSTYFYNEDILNIINEDAAAYFSGQKSVDEVARIIQSRAQVYVNENR